VVEDPITLERIASEPGRPHLARCRCGGHGSRREVEETKPPGKRRGVGRLHSTCEASNNAGLTSAAEMVEGRRPVEGKVRSAACPGHRAGLGMSQKL
jgi:hypothetical protein